MRRDLRVVYFIDARDKIIFVNENWDEHARENNAHHLTGQNILGCDLWQFISHETLRQVYREFIRRARVSEAVRVEFNGLSSAHRYPTVVRVEGDPKIVRFEIEVAEKRLRNPSDDPARISPLVLCSWCRRIDFSEGTWIAAEEAIELLRVFEMEPIPDLSHGICRDCYKLIGSQFKNIR